MSYNADINICMLVNCFCAVGGCAIVGGCASSNSDCDSDVLWLCQCWGGEAAEQVSYNADINICMLVNCFCAIGGCAIAGSEGDSDGNMCGCDGTREGETAAWVSCIVIVL